jgi:hypothetical protein
LGQLHVESLPCHKASFQRQYDTGKSKPKEFI